MISVFINTKSNYYYKNQKKIAALKKQNQFLVYVLEKMTKKFTFIPFGISKLKEKK